ncbi:hypothetical protein [Streptomyces sp. NRRL F-5630]|uniref:hypothetical protein n=1 Tax=Streptomyces sp. NRRL F-5630 TaxID=1463864 RepID=UPI003EB917E2
MSGAEPGAVAPPAPVSTSTGPNATTPAPGTQSTPPGAQQGTSGTGNQSQQSPRTGLNDPGDLIDLSDPGDLPDQRADQDEDRQQELTDGTNRSLTPPPPGVTDDTVTDLGTRTTTDTTGPDTAPAPPPGLRTSSDAPRLDETAAPPAPPRPPHADLTGDTDMTVLDSDAPTGDAITGDVITTPDTDADPDGDAPTARTPEPAMPVADPVRPEQWRAGRHDAPAVPVRTERFDPALDPGQNPPGPGLLDGRDTLVRMWVQRIQADDGRWVRNVSLHLPVRFGEGFDPAGLAAYQERINGLLTKHLNNGLLLPESGDQLHLDLTLTPASDHPEAIELSRTPRPDDSDQLHLRLHTHDTSLSPEARDEQRERDDATALHELLHYAGVPDRGRSAKALFRRLVRQSDSYGLMADHSRLPDPAGIAVPLHYLRTVESVIDTGAVLRDHPLSARGTRPPSGIDDPARAPRMLAPADRPPVHPPSQAESPAPAPLHDNDHDGIRPPDHDHVRPPTPHVSVVSTDPSAPSQEPKGQNETNTPPPKAPGTAKRWITDLLAESHPPEVDRDMAPPSRERRSPAQFEDGHSIPAYLDDLQALLPHSLTDAERAQLLATPATFGQSNVHLRGIDQVVAVIENELGRIPAAKPGKGAAQLLTDIRRTLRDKPKTFTDGGRPFPYVDADGNVRVLRITTRHYGRWSSFKDAFGHPAKIDSMHRAAATFGLVKNMQANAQWGAGGPIGPAGTTMFGGFGRLAVRFGFINKVGYTLTDQRMNQMETRTLDGSRAYLDSVYYEVRVTDAAGHIVTGLGTGTDTATGNTTETGAVVSTSPVQDADTAKDTSSAAGRQALFGLAVRHGLLVRLPDSVTKLPTPGRIPRSMTLDREAQYRFVRIEGFGPVAAIRDWAAARIGALPGSSAYRELDTFFSGDSFQRHGGTMARGRITTPPLFADDKRKSPLGVFVVEEVIPRAAILFGETDKAEMRDINTSTIRSERNRVEGKSLTVQAAGGPAFNFADPLGEAFDLRLQAGPTGQYTYATTRSTGLGGAGTTKSAGHVKGPRTALYVVVKSVYVRRSGDGGPPRQFLTWSLDRMTSAEARRLAGWDDGTRLALRHGGPPRVPAYLTVDRPRTLGMHRVKEFAFPDGRRTDAPPTAADAVGRTLLDAFADRVVTAVAARRQGLVAPLDQLLPPNPPKGWRARFNDLLERDPGALLKAARGRPVPPQWSDPARYRTALQNTLQILGVLSQQNVTASLEALTTTGLRIRLVDPDAVGQTYYYVWVHGELTGRSYEGRDIDEGMRFSAQGIDRLDGQVSAKRGTEIGFEGTLSGRDNNVDSAGMRENTLGLTLGARKGWQREAESAFGSTVGNEPMSVTTKPMDLYRFDIVLTAVLGGYWRPRGLVRGLGLGLPGLLVLDEPVNVLFGRSARGFQQGGGPVAGKVLISVPSQHAPAADPHADGALNPYTAVEPAPVPMAPERALALAKGDLMLPAGADGAGGGRLADRGSAPFRELRKHPFVIVSMVLSPTLLAGVDRVLKEASGGAWQLMKEGAPTRDAVVRTFTPQYLTASFDQSSGPLGLASSGLLGKGPAGELWGTFRYATTVSGLRALTPSMSMDTEMTLGATRQAGGKASNSTVFVFGGQLVYAAPRHPGHGVMGTYGLVANPVSLSHGRSRSVVRTVVADMNRKGFTHQVLVAGDVDHWFAMVTSRLGMGRIGTTAAASSLVPRLVAGTAGLSVTTPGGLLGHLPEKNAHRLGLLDDGLGEVPRYARQPWAPQPWMRGTSFGTYAVNALDPTRALTAFEERIRKLGLDEASRERVRQLVSGRATRALKGEMTTTAPATPVSVGAWGWGGVWIGGRWVRARVELIPGTPRFEGLDHSVELEENRRAVETVQEGSDSSSGADVGFLTSQMVYTGNPDVVGAGPTYSEGGSHKKTVTSGHTTTSITIYRAASTEPYAEVVTPYRMRITLEADDTPDASGPAGRRAKPGEETATAFDRFRGRQRIVEEHDVGELHEHVPLSLMEPVMPAPESGSAAALPPLPAADPGADPALARAPRPAPLPATDRTVLVRYGDGVERPFTFPENGIHPKAIVGIENIRAANDLLLTRAYDAGFSIEALRAEDGPDPDVLTELLRRAKQTGLTRVGSGAAQALEDGTGYMALTAFFPRTVETDGYQVAGLAEKHLTFTTDVGELTLRSTPDFSRAVLLTVGDGNKLEVLRRHGENASTSSADEHSQSSSLGGGFLYNSPDQAGLNQVGISGPGPNDLDGDGIPVGDDHLTSRNLKPNTGRSFLFAVPATWLSTGAVHRGLLDSKAAHKVGGTFGLARPGPQAMTSEAYVVAWIREDIARELMLISDTSFPARVGKAWDAVKKVSADWVAADQAYWKKRREGTALREERTAALVELNRANEGVQTARRTLDAARAEVEAAMAPATAPAAKPVPAAVPAEVTSTGGPSTVPRLDPSVDASIAASVDPSAGRSADPSADPLVIDARAREAAAVEGLTGALRAVDSAKQRVADANRAFEKAGEKLRGELVPLLDAANGLAAEYHRLRHATDQLTRWHQLMATEEGRKTLDGRAEPPAVTYEPVKKTEKAVPPRYRRSGEGADARLIAPVVEESAAGDSGLRAFARTGPVEYALHDVPRDGDAFFHVLLDGLERAGRGDLLTAAGIDLSGARDAAVARLREVLAARLSETGESGLSGFVTVDGTDTFTPAEVAGAGLVLGENTAARREFDALGVIPHAVDLSDDARTRLAAAQLGRAGGAGGEAGWNNSATDLLPGLASRAFGVRITVVRADGSFQDFAPPVDSGRNAGTLESDLDVEPGPAPPHVVLSLTDKHFQLALPVTDTDTEQNTAVPDSATPPEGPGTDPQDAPQPPVTDVPVTDTPATDARPEDTPGGGKDIGKETGEGTGTGAGTDAEVSGAGPGRGRRVSVPLDGECVLSSFMASAPLHIRDRLPGLSESHPAAYAWLSSPEAVHDDLRRRTGHPLPTDQSPVVAEAMRAHVLDHLRRAEESGTGLDRMTRSQFRGHRAGNLARRFDALDREQLLAQLAHHGVTAVTLDALGDATLRMAYVNARTAHREDGISDADIRTVASTAESRDLFTYLDDRGLLPPVTSLGTTGLRTLLERSYPVSDAPLDGGEYASLRRTVADWSSRWNSPEGEVLVPLLAQALDLRVDVLVGGDGPGTRLLTTVGPETAPRRTEVYYSGNNHYDGSDATPIDRERDFGATVAPKRVKDEERDDAGDVRLNPLWVPLDEFSAEVLTRSQDGVWLYTVTGDGRVVLGSEQPSALIEQEQFDRLLAGMREKDPGLTAEALRDSLDGLGHTGVAAEFSETSGRTAAGKARVSGEFRWDKELDAWTVNDKSGRYMSDKVRPDVDPERATAWLENVAKLFAERLGATVVANPVKTKATPPAPPAPAPTSNTEAQDHNGTKRQIQGQDQTRERPAETVVATPPAPVGTSTAAPTGPTAESTADAAIAGARVDHEESLTAFGRAARTVALLHQRVKAGEGSDEDVLRFHDARKEAAQAQRRLDDALDRLRALDARAADAAVAAIVPRVDRTDAERGLTAALVSADDLPDDPPRLAPDDTITTAQLNAAEVALREGPALQAALNGSLPVRDSRLGLADHVRLLMVRPGPWDDTLDSIAAHASRRTWRSAHDDFALATARASGAPADTDPDEVWWRAVSLVLPLRLHPVLVDSRYAGAAFRDAVRQLAEHLAVHGQDAVSGIDLANRLRHGLGVPPLPVGVAGPTATDSSADTEPETPPASNVGAAPAPAPEPEREPEPEPEPSESRTAEPVDVEPADGEFDRAALRMEAATFTQLLVTALNRQAPELLAAGPGATTPEALVTWLDTTLTKSVSDGGAAVPGTGPLLAAHEKIPVSTLKSLHVELTSDQYLQAVLQGDQLSVRDAGLTRTQQFRLLLTRPVDSDTTNAGFIQTLAEFTAHQLAFRLLLLDTAGHHLALGPADGPIVSLDLRGTHPTPYAPPAYADVNGPVLLTLEPGSPS